MERRIAEQQYQAMLDLQRALLEPAYLNPKAAKAIELLSIDKPSGETLYKIYELAEGGRKRSAFQAEFGVTEDMFNRFKDAVHNPLVSGDWARHANSQKLNSADPMTSTDAEEFVRKIAAKWLDSVRRKKCR